MTFPKPPYGYCYDGSSTWSIGPARDPQMAVCNINDRNDDRARAICQYLVRVANCHEELVAACKLAKVLLAMRPPTVRDVIESDEATIRAVGLNPWCINEGLATGEESINLDFLTDAIAKATETAVPQ